MNNYVNGSKALVSQKLRSINRKTIRVGACRRTSEWREYGAEIDGRRQTAARFGADHRLRVANSSVADALPTLQLAKVVDRPDCHLSGWLREQLTLAHLH